jgi:hypothetical protein
MPRGSAIARGGRGSGLNARASIQRESLRMPAFSAARAENRQGGLPSALRAHGSPLANAAEIRLTVENATAAEARPGRACDSNHRAAPKAVPNCSHSRWQKFTK